MRFQRSPQVSVLMPVFNAGAWLREAVDSVLAQTLEDFELLVIDNESTDGSLDYLCDLQRQEPRLRLLRQPRQSLSKGLNQGLAAARASLVARLDADDLAYPDRLERQVGAFNASPELGLLGSWAHEIDGRGRLMGQRRPPTDCEALNEILPRANPFVHSSIMARTELLVGLGGYRCVFEAAEDYDLWLRVAEVAEVANLPELLVSYRLHDGGVSQSQRLRQAFSARLAQRAARARRAGDNDPADDLAGPPDWRCAHAASAFYAPDAALYRWLERAEDSVRAEDAAGDLLFDQLPQLNHVERRLAAEALMAQMRSADRTEARCANSLLLRLCRERPSTVLRAAWSLRPRPLRDVVARGR